MRNRVLDPAAIANGDVPAVLAVGADREGAVLEGAVFDRDVTAVLERDMGRP